MSSVAKPSEYPPVTRAARSLTFRLNAWYAAVFSLSVLALVALAVPVVLRALHSQDSLVMESRVERHVAVLQSGLPRYQAAVESSATLNETDAPVRVRDEAGRTLFAHGNVTSSRVVVERSVGSMHVEVGTPSPGFAAVLQRLEPAALGLLLVALALSVAGGLALTRRGLRPVRELAAAASEVSRSGDLTRRVPERGSGDELDELSRLFNRMLERNQALVAGMRGALDNVAHDLRTPLTRLRGTAELALRSGDSAQAKEALAVCIEESERLQTMLRTLMDISEAETGLMKLERAPVSLNALVGSVAELYEAVAEQNGVSMSVATPENVQVDADANRLRQALANLVDNALKYTPSGGQVFIEVTHDARDGVVRVRDTGEGIPPDALPRIFERLYRAEPSRSKPGLGLGLSLVQAIVAAHGGRVEVESTPGRGSTFTVRIPRAVTAPAAG